MRRRETVGAKSNPRQKCHKHHMPPRLFVKRIERLAENEVGDFALAWHSPLKA
jgi:hypothetical protein